MIKKSKDLIKAIKKHDEKKSDGDSIAELKKLLDDRKKARKEYDEILKNVHESIMKENKENAERRIKEIEKLNKMINDNPDMSSKKKEIINELIELYNIMHLYYLNIIDNNLEKNKEIDYKAINSKIRDLSLKLIIHKGKGYVNLPILLSKLNVTNSKELISDMKNLLNNLQDTKQITKQVNNNLIKAITQV